MKNIVFTGGGTAGHCTPNLAIIEQIKDKFDRVAYIGSFDGIERKIIEGAGIEYFAISCAKLQRKITPSNLALPFKVLKGVTEAKKIIKNISPCLLFSKGGYVSLPAVIAAKKCRVKVIVHESDFSVGLANKMASRYCDSFLTSFESASRQIEGAKTVGCPLRSSLFTTVDKGVELRRLGINGKKRVLLVIGGSQGSLAINTAVDEAEDELLKLVDIIHICGRGKVGNPPKRGRVKLEYCEDMGKLYSICDYAISRAGANTLFELCALCLPTLAIPLPRENSRGDQIENAKYFADKGLIEVLLQDNLSKDTMIKSLKSLILKGEQIKKNCQGQNFREGTKLCVDEILSLSFK